jgi:hypothetical protein
MLHPLTTQQVPGGPTILRPAGVGSIFFVDSNGGGSTTAGGLSPTSAFTTLSAAIGACTSSKGDIIYVMPGHAETISAAAGIAVNKIGVSIIGLGSGTLQPKITFDTIITADLDVDAASVTFENIHFSANFADITAALDINATDCTFRNCRFSETAVNMNAVIWILAATSTTSSRLRIEGCRALDKDAANTHFVSFPGTSDGDAVIDCVLQGDWGTAAIGAVGVITNCAILNNRIFNAATDNDSIINLAATATGVVMGNLAAGGAAQANGITAQGCAKCENYYGVIAEDLNGILEPIAT